MAIQPVLACELPVTGDGTSTTLGFNLYQAPLVGQYSDATYPAWQVFGGKLPLPSSVTVAVRGGSISVSSVSFDAFGNVNVVFGSALSSGGATILDITCHF